MNLSLYGLRFVNYFPERKRAKDIPLELREQWEKDRYKKAENKKKRACDRQRAEAEFTGGKKGKKGWKAKLAAMRASDDEDSSQSLDIVAVERSIRRFLLDLDSHKLELHPCNKQTRIKLHEIANAFQLKSSSQGKGKNRFTTLTRTAKSGVRIDEKKIRRILQTGGGSWDSDGRKGKGGKATSLAKHREGEEVGKVSCRTPYSPVSRA